MSTYWQSSLRYNGIPGSWRSVHWWCNALYLLHEKWIENVRWWPRHWFNVSRIQLYQKLMTQAKLRLPGASVTKANANKWMQRLISFCVLQVIESVHELICWLMWVHLFEAFLDVPIGCRPQSQVLSPGSAPSPSHTDWLRSCRTSQSRRSSDWTRSPSTSATPRRGCLSTVSDLKRIKSGGCHMHFSHAACVLFSLNWRMMDSFCAGV